MRKILYFLLFLSCLSTAVAQAPAKRKIQAVRTTLPVKIDGEINDEAWKQAPVADGFTEQRPTFGKAEEESTKTSMFILYDDNAIYLAGICRETTRDSISTELIGRDRVGINDFAGVAFDTYSDEINGFGFFVTALGEQYDCKYSIGNEDGNWSTVYQTATKIGDQGWTFEMRIPYSAVRFSKEAVQNWGVNFFRRRLKTGQQLFWNPVDPQKFGFLNQAGSWAGIENIEPPIRLFFSPYFSSYLTKNPDTKKWVTSVNGGMDVKYGISKAFTLDMTLIPDFGQVQSDNQVLNLTPFEVRYNENRAFFTEGTELFNKGNLFYSRRIGGTPLHYGRPYSRLQPGETVIKNPSETKLINATKVSGRTAKGLGIGFFNAVTKAQHAVVEDDAKQRYEIETNPLTNYNIIVLDQTMKYNSSVSLVNTNVMRSGSDYDANVTAFLWDVYDKNINWNAWGQVANSRLIGLEGPGKTLSGYQYRVFAGKFKGPWNFDVHQFLADDKYDQRDMGYFTNNNYLDHGFWTGYKWTKPKGFYNNLYLNMNGTYSQRLKPRAYQYVAINANINGQLKNLWNFGIAVNIRPEQQDFYESRIGTPFRVPGYLNKGFWLGTNRSKKYYLNVEYFHKNAPKYKAQGSDLWLVNSYRFNDKLTVSMNNNLFFINREAGFGYTFTDATSQLDSVVFGLRNRRTAENVFNVKYNFNIKMGLTLRVRHYWSKVDYSEFFDLKQDGHLQPRYAPITKNPDNNVNFFNVDMIYTWQFAPASFLNIGWKDAGQKFDQNITDQYYSNLRNILRHGQQNSFSVKVIYFLDYLSLRPKQLKKAG